MAPHEYPTSLRFRRRTRPRKGWAGKESFERKYIIPRTGFYSNQHGRESNIFVAPPGT